jgi:hypothetical protein
MALRPNSTYAYTDLSDAQVFVKTGDLTDLLDWSPSTTYSFRDAALYNGAYYVCLTANTNTPPSGNISDEWSTLVLVRDGSSGGHTADEAYALAEEALETAVEVGQQGSNYSYELFVAGTNYTNNTAVSAIGTAVQQGSEFAYNLFLDGTNYTNNVAVSAIAVAVQQGSEFAYNLFLDGTNYTNTAAVAAVQVAAQQGSQFATILHDAGTNYTNEQIAIAVFNVGNSGSEFSVILRDQGTNYTNQQIAAEAIARTNGDSAVFVAVNNRIDIETGQRIHDDGTVASNGSAFSYLLYTTGTDYAQTLVQVEAAARIAGDFNTYVAGTNYTDQVVQQQSVIISGDALALYWQGTAFTDLRVTAERSARQTNDDSLQSWIGTNTSSINQLAAILGASFNGTFSLYMAQVSRGKPDTKITVVGGVVTGFEQSPFVWDDFSGYVAGPAGPFDKGSSWDVVEYGSIRTDIFSGTVAQDRMQTYANGTIFLLDAGIGFPSFGTFAQPFANQLGIDSFDYSLGTIVNPDMNGGTDWASPAVIHQY